MTENMKKFLESVSKNEELCAKIGVMGKDELIALAKELGVELTDADLAKPTQELDDDDLDTVAGGAFGDMATCPVCGKPKLEGYICIWCEMADGVVTCHKCRGQLTKEGGCANCGTTWDEYVQLTKHLRGE